MCFHFLSVQVLLSLILMGVLPARLQASEPFQTVKKCSQFKSGVIKAILKDYDLFLEAEKKGYGKTLLKSLNYFSEYAQKNGSGEMKVKGVVKTKSGNYQIHGASKPLDNSGNGDKIFSVTTADRTFIFVLDGVGHGFEGDVVSKGAKEIIEKVLTDSPNIELKSLPENISKKLENRNALLKKITSEKRELSLPEIFDPFSNTVAGFFVIDHQSGKVSDVLNTDGGSYLFKNGALIARSEPTWFINKKGGLPQMMEQKRNEKLHQNMSLDKTVILEDSDILVKVSDGIFAFRKMDNSNLAVEDEAQGLEFLKLALKKYQENPNSNLNIVELFVSEANKMKLKPNDDLSIVVVQKTQKEALDLIDENTRKNIDAAEVKKSIIHKVALYLRKVDEQVKNQIGQMLPEISK